MVKNKFYITTPIYYVNANPHIGHAYTQIIVDALSRYYRLTGKEVFFLTGTDEHGEKIEEASRKAGLGKGREKEFVDKIVTNFKKTWKKLGIKYDYFIRTTDEVHKKVVQGFLTKMKENDDIYLGEYDGWFCTPCETFWTDTQAEEGVCPDCKRKLDRIKEKNYFFRMSKYQKWLEKHIKENPDFIKPDCRRNEVLGFLKEGLNDLCVSRSKERMSWGIEMPFDESYVVYVWFDALINYISGLEACNVRDKFWPADFHIIAKDILRHHAVYWPVMLKSVGMEMPKTIFAHGWWKMGDEKMSKSKGNIVDPLALEEKYGLDPFRYFLIKAIGFGLDGVFSEDALVSMYNSDLANDLGNLLNRSLTMVDKYFEGIVPSVDEDKTDSDQKVRSKKIESAVCVLIPAVKEYIENSSLRLKEALEQIMGVVGVANKYIEESAPWEYSKKNDTESIKMIIVDILEALRVVAITIAPFMPETSGKIWKQLGLGDIVDEKIVSKEFADKKETGNWRRFAAGIKTAKGDPIFPRIK